MRKPLLDPSIPELATLLGAALLALPLLISACEPTSRQELGKSQFEEHCVACHSAVSGEIATEGQQMGPDLRLLQPKYGSPLDRDRLARFIDGREELPAHGTRQMPVWGKRLYEDYPQTQGTESVREGTVAIILDYLESIQLDDSPE